MKNLLSQTAEVEVTSALLSSDGCRSDVQADVVAVEEPIEIRLRLAGETETAERAVSITMRTPGEGGDPREDAELAVGFLFTEGILRGPGDVAAVHHPAPSRVVVALAAGVTPQLQSLERNFYTTSACGVCGKGSIDAIHTKPASPIETGARIPVALLCRLPERLRGAQTAFSQTGGIHAAGWFRSDGTLVAVREDVGRHNAVDKLIGAQLLAGAIPARGGILVVSGRASFELVQKARMASLPIFVAVGAPSSLAVQLAQSCGMTLLGFVRDGRCNIYAGPERVLLQEKEWEAKEAEAQTPRRRLRTTAAT